MGGDGWGWVGSRTYNVTAMRRLTTTAVPATAGTVSLGNITNVAACVKSGAVTKAATAYKKMARSIYDSVPCFTIDTSGVDTVTGSGVDEPGEFGSVTMMAACTGAAPRDSSDDKHAAAYYNGQVPAIHCAMEALLKVLAEQGGHWGQYGPRASCLPTSYPPPLPKGPGGPVGVGGGRGDG